MENKPLTPAQSAYSGTEPDALNMAVSPTTASGFAYAQPSNPPLESLEVHDEGVEAAYNTPTEQPTYTANPHTLNFSRRRAAIVSAIITVVIVLISGLSVALLSRRHPDKPASLATGIPTQAIQLKQAGSNSIPPELQGAAESLLVNGDIISKGSLKFSDDAFVTILRPQTLTANQTYSLPNASGTLCLDNNNCNFASTAAVQQLQQQLAQIVIPTVPAATTLNGQGGAISLQGTSNQISVSTSNGVITLATPQDIAPISSPTFANLVLSGNFSLSGTVTLPLNCSALTNGGSLTTNGSGQIICSNDDGGGGGGTVSSPGGTVGTIPLFTAAQTIADSIISEALGTITINGDLEADSLTLAAPLSVPNGGTGVTTFAANGVLYGNGAGALLNTGAPASGQVLLGSVGGVPTFTGVSGDIAITGAGVTTIQANSVALGADTTGNYVQNLAAGTGTTVGGGSGEGVTNTINVTFGSVANTSVEGNTQITVTAGTNLSGGGTITLGAGGSVTVNTVNNPTFTTSVTTPLLSLTGAGSPGSLVIANLGQATTYTLPDPGAASATICLSSGNCVGGSGGAPNSAAYLTVGNDGTLSGERAITAGTNLTAADGGTNSTYTISTVNNPSFTTSVTTPLLQSSGALAITPGGALTVGATGQTALLQGSTTTITSNGAGNDIVLTTADQIRLTGFNCTGFTNGGVLTTDASGNISCTNDDGEPAGGITGSGTANRVTLFTGSQTVGDSWLLQNGSTLEIDNTRNLSLLGGNFDVTGTGTFSGTLTANGNFVVQTGDNFTVNGDAFTDLTGTGLVISSGSLQTTLGTSVDLAAEVTGILPVTNGGTGINGSSAANGTLLIGNGSGYTLATLTQGAGITITNGSGSITVANAFGASIDLGTETTGDYVEDITAGNGLSGSASGVGSNPTLALGPLTANWNQTGAFDISLNNASSELRILESAGDTFFGTLDVGDLSADRTYTFPNATGEVCLVEAGNCAGSGSGVTTPGGTTNQIAKFTGAQSIDDSTISDDGTNVTTSVDLIIQGGSATLGTTSQAASLVLHDGDGETITLNLPDVSASYSLVFPAAVGSANQCLKAQDGSGTLFWDNCLGGGGGGITSVDGQTGPAITINNATGSSNVITIDNAAADGSTKGIAAFNATNFTAASGVINTVQDISTSATPSFAGLTLTGNLSLAANTIQGTTAVIDFTNFDVASNGNVTAGTYNGQDIDATANLTGTLTVTGLTTLNGGLTLEAGDTLTVNGDAFTDLTGNGLAVSGNALTIAVQANKGLEVDGNGLSLIDCAQDEILKYNGSNQWVCAADAGGAGLGDNVSVNGTGATDANFLDVAGSGTVASTTWSLNAVSNPDDITLAIGNASATEAGAVTTGAQTFAGAKTFNGSIIAGAGVNLGTQTLQGTTAVIDFNNFDVSSAGAVTAVGVNAGSGLLQGTGGLTVSGTITLSSLTNGFLEVNGSGVVSVGTIDLGTDTAGNYVATITAGNGISGSSATEGGTPTIALSNLTADWLQSGAFDITLDNSSSELKIRESSGAFYAILDVSDIGSDQTFTLSEGGTVVTTGNVASHATTGVTAGSGLTGGGTVGALTLDIASANGGIVVNANDITLTLQANKGLEVDANGLSLIDCASGEILKYNGSNQWACATDAGGAGVGDDVSVNSTNATGANFLDAAGSGTSAATTWTLTTASSPDDITLAIGNASATEAGAVTTGVQTFAGAKTFNGQIVAGAGINLGAQTLQGTTAVINFDNFDVSSAGAITAVGVNAGSGLLQGTGGLTVSGTITLSSLTNGFLEVNGSGVVSVGTIDLGTDTNGNYVATITAGNGISGSSASEGGTPTIALSALTADWLQSGAFDISLDHADSELKIRESSGAFYAILDVSDLSADQTFTLSEGGTVVTSGNVASHATTGVTAGNGLTGGGTVGVLTLNIASANGGIVVNANDIALTLQANKGLEVDGNGLSLIDCASGEILKYNGSNQWACAPDAGASGTGDDISVNSTAATNANFLDTAASATAVATTWNLVTASTPDDITISLGAASGSDAGIVTANAQTFGGAKTFNGQIIAGAGINLGSQTLQGTTAVIDFNNFDVSSAGAVTAVGVNAGSGLLQGTGGLTVSGTVTLSSLTNGFLEVNGSGVVSVGTIDLGTDTNGNYVATITAGNGISGSSATEGGTPTIALSNLTADWLQSGAFDITLDHADSELKIRESSGAFYAILDVGDLAADQTFTFLEGGTVVTSGNVASHATTGVTAGSGLTGGGTVGALTLNIASANGGIVINANDITLTVQANKGLEVDGSGLSLIDCATDEILKYNGSNQWVCAADAGGAGLGDDVSVNGTGVTGANFLNTAASGTVASTTWSLNAVSNPDDITIAIGTASDTEAGIVNTNAQTFAGAKTFNGSIIAGAGVNLGTQTLQGTTAVIDFNNFDVSSAGAVTAVGVNAGSGLLQGTGGLTVTGTVTLSSLTNGFLEVNGSGVVSVGTIDLGTDTNGNYVATITAGNGISGSSATEGGTPTIALSNLTADWLQSGAFDITLDHADSELKIRESSGASYAILDVSDIASDQTFTLSEGGTVVTTGNVASHATTGVTAGSGLTGGGTVGALTVDIASANGGIVVNANDIALTLQANKGLEVDANGLSLIDCSDGQVLKYNGSNQWACAADNDTNTTYSAGNDLDLSGTTFDIESQLDFVSTISQTGANLTLQTITSGNIVLNSAGTIELQDNSNVTGTLTASGLITANGGLTLEAGDTFTVNGDAFTDLTGTGLQVVGNALQTTLGVSIQDGEVDDNITISSSGSVDWTALTNYPSACAAGSAVSTLADSPTCTAFNTDTSITLQDAYVAGNTIGTVAGEGNIALTLTDDANDHDFVVNLQGANNTMEVQANGTTYLTATGAGTVTYNTTGDDGIFSINSVLGAGGRGEVLLDITQSNHATGDSTNVLVSINQQDTGSAEALTISHAGISTAVGILSTGTANALQATTTGTGTIALFNASNASANGVSIDVQSSGSGQYALNVTSNNGSTNGLYVRADGHVGIGTATPGASLTVVGGSASTDSVNITTNDLTSGDGLSITAYADQVSAFSGNAAYILEGNYRFTASSITDTGHVLKLERSLEIDGGGTLNITGAVADFVSNTCVITSGTCNDSSNILRLQQAYASASGAVLNIQNSGSGADIAFNTTPVLTIGDTGTLNITDGTNTLLVLTDAGSAGNLTASGTLEVQGASVTIGGTSQQGSAILHDGSGETVTIRSGNQTANRIYTIPITTGDDTFCLVILTNCSGSATTLQASYDADTNGSDTLITLSANDDSLIVRNPASSGTDTAFTLQVDNLATGSTATGYKNLNVTSAGSFNTTAASRTNYGLYVSNTSTESAGSNVLTNIGLYVTASGGDNNYAAIFQNGKVGIGMSPVATFDITGEGGSGSNNAPLAFKVLGGTGGININDGFKGGGIELTAGNGGDAFDGINGEGGDITITAGNAGVAGGTPADYARGGRITLQAGSATSLGTASIIMQASGGNVGIGTTAPDKALEVNSANGNNLRLTYNDTNGSATNYADLLMSSNGTLTIQSNGSAAGADILLRTDSFTNALRVDDTNSYVSIAGATGSLTGRDLVVADLDITTKLRIGDGTNGISFNDEAANQLRYRGTARNDVVVALKPEFEGAILRADGSSNTGTMVSDLCSGSSRLSINTSICSATQEHTYYEWTTSEASAQDYDVYVRWRVPSDFDASSGFQSNISFTMYGWRTDTSNNSILVNMFNDAGGTCGTADQQVAGTGGSWNTLTFAGMAADSDCNSTNIQAGDYIWFRFRMNADTGGDFVRLGEIEISYKSTF